MNPLSFYVIFLFAVFFKDTISQENKPVTQSCIGCICLTRSDCEPSCESTEKGPCGPFFITRDYWLDGYKPTINGESSENSTAFSNCVQDINCAYLTMQGYMNRYQKDCNGDSKIDCDDFVKMHILGAFGCTEQLDNSFEERYRHCKENVVLSNNNV